jgi:hypothetical protein
MILKVNNERMKTYNKVKHIPEYVQLPPFPPWVCEVLSRGHKKKGCYS